MLALTENGLRLVGASDLGRVIAIVPPPAPAGLECFGRFTANELLHVLKSRSCRESLENFYPSNEQPEISCQEASDRLLRVLTLPKCEGWTDEEYARNRREVALTILSQNLGSEKLQGIAREIFKTEGRGGVGPVPPASAPGFDLMGFLRRYGVYIALGVAALLLLRRR